jgi:hypothetical protein
MRSKTALDIITEKRASAQPPVKPIGGFLGRNAPALSNSTALSMIRNRLAQIASGRNQRNNFGIDPYASKIEEG